MDNNFTDNTETVVKDFFCLKLFVYIRKQSKNVGSRTGINSLNWLLVNIYTVWMMMYIYVECFEEDSYLSNKYGYEGVPPSLKIWDEQHINAFCPNLSAIHQPKVNKWDYKQNESYNLLINECAVPYTIKRMMYPKICQPLLKCSFVIRKKKYLKNIPQAENKVKSTVRDFWQIMN